MRIWKYELDVGLNELAMPYGARVLHLAAQGQIPCMWALVNPDNPPKLRTFAVVGTGHEIDQADRFDYLGTFHITEGLATEFVGHVFEELVPPPSRPG
jgi:hypothetical protein